VQSYGSLLGQGASADEKESEVVKNSTPLIWISSIQESVASHFKFMKRIWAVAVANGRSLTVVPYTFANETFRICDFFEFPETIKCSSQTRVQILRNTPCTRLEIDGAGMTDYYKPDLYGLSDQFNLAALPAIDWKTSNCVIGMPITSQFTDESNAPPLIPTFNLRAIQLYEKAMMELSVDSENITAIHWIRRDSAAPSCGNVSSSIYDSVSSVSCGTVQNFVDVLNRMFPNNSSNVYISTNEADRRELKSLKGAGFNVLNAGKYVYTPLLKYIIDLQAMMLAQTFISWSGSSSTKDLVVLSRKSSVLTSSDNSLLDESEAGPEIHVTLPQIDKESGTSMESATSDENNTEDPLENLEGLDTEATLLAELKSASEPSPIDNSILQYVTHPILIIVVILLLLTWCAYDILRSNRAAPVIIARDDPSVTPSSYLKNNSRSGKKGDRKMRAP
jgi:hypothetical protein